MKLWENLRGARGLEWMLLAVCLTLMLMLLLRDEENVLTATELETRLEATLSCVEGAGQVRVLVNEGETGVLGVLIVAEGAQDLRVRLELEQAAHSILGVELERIEVLRMEVGN